MHQHEHGEEHSVVKIITLIASVLLFLSALLFLHGAVQFIAYLAAYALSGWSVLKEAAENLLHGNLFDENFLMTIASIGALGIGEYPEAVAVMLLYEIGEWMQDKAVDSSQRSIQALLAVRPDQATLLSGEVVAAKDVVVGTKIIVRPGDRVSLDGRILSGTAMVDTAALTGESLPRQWTVGDSALAGCIVQDGVLTVEVTKPFEQSSVSRIMALIETAQENKAKPERFITRFAKIYTPIVCAIAVLVAILPPLLRVGTWELWIHKALSFLVISCPCALVISVPLAFFAGIGCASHHGILLKGGNYLDLLAKAKIAVFDKTGTLTQGKFLVTDVVGGQKVLEIAAYCEKHSTHPLAKSIVSYYKNDMDPTRITCIREIPGQGISARFDGADVRVGKREFVADSAEKIEETAVYVSENNKYLGYIVLRDALKPDAKDTMEQLRKLGVSQLIMLSGDKQNTVEEISSEIGLNCAYSELLPGEKVEKMSKISQQGITLYTGDGINDSPVLSCADVGIAMGGLGSEAAMEAADMVLLTDELLNIPKSIRIARKTMRIARENIAFSIFIKVATLTATLVGNMALWVAVMADVGVCILAVMNSMRALHIKSSSDIR